MGRMIDADCLKEKLGKYYGIACDCADGVVDSIENEIDSAPTINQWIPVTERLPDKEAEYMVTKEHLGSKEREVTTEWWIPHSNNWACFKFGWAIIAWAEKPTPYEWSEEDESNN